MPNHNTIVSKHNDLIPSLARLELQELRLLAYCLAQLDSVHDLDFQETTATVQEMSDLYGIKHNDAYRMVRQAVLSINENPAEFEEEGKKKLRFWFAGMDYTHNEGSFTFHFNPLLKPYLLQLKGNFTRFRLKDVYQFKAKSTWHLYETLRQWKEAGKAEFDLAKFKLLLGIEGQYARFSNLKARILDPATQEINETSDIRIVWEQINRGRRIIGLRFHIAPNEATKTPREKIREKAEKALGARPCLAPDLAKLLREEYRVNAKQAKQLADLASGDREAEARSMLPKLRKRWEKLPEAKRVALGGYVFKALKAHLTQGTLI